MNIIQWLKKKSFIKSSTEAREPDKPSSPKTPNKIQQKASPSSQIVVEEIIIQDYPKSPADRISEFESFVGEFDEEEIDKLKGY